MELTQAYASIAFDLLAVERELRSQLEMICRDREFVDRVIRFFFQIPGKKLRPSLVLLSAFALRRSNLVSARHLPVYRNLVQLATLTELVHSASLMHDDVLDDAAMRRGIPSVNAKFGNKVAILAGDILYSHAFELLAATSEKRVFMLLARCVHQMCRGEIINLSEHDFGAYQQIIEDKTAAFMAFCCEAGALAVAEPGDDASQIAALSRFGYHFGMVYQLCDDLGDRDDTTAMAHRDWVVDLLEQHVGSARDAMCALPPSDYAANLGMLLDYVVSRYDASAVAAAGSA